MTVQASLHRIPVYEVRLIPSRRPLRLAERTLNNSGVSAHALHALLGFADREQLACLFLNGQNEIVGAHIAAIGGQHMIAAIDARVIFRAALAACTTSLVLGHNHPSGDPTPSHEDIQATACIMRASHIVDIPVLDHVIVTRDPLRYHSMFERGTLPRLE